MRQTKSFPIRRLKVIDAEAGTFEALVSVFGNVDYAKERVVNGAFTKTLDRWKSSGDPIPVIWAHMWDDPFAHIGKSATATQTTDGLLVSAQLDLDKPFAKQVFDLMKERRVKEFSFAYDVLDSARSSDGVLDLTELDLIEVGPCLKGMNPATQLVTVKAMARDLAGRAKTTRGAKAWVQLEGSYEDLQSDLDEALEDLFPQGFAFLEATFPDYVIAGVYDWYEDEPSYFQIPYSLDDAGESTFGVPTQVEITADFVPAKRRDAAAKARAKEGRRNAATDQQRVQTMHDLSVDLGAECAPAEDDSLKSRGKAKAEDPSTRKQSPSSLRASLELLEAEIA